MDKEKVTKDINIRVQPSLFEKLRKRCKTRYKTISEVIRELIVQYVEGDKQ